MGRHSSRAQAKRAKRTFRNAVAVLVAVVVTALGVLVGMTFVANHELHEIPPPTVMSSESFLERIDAGEDVIPPPTVNAGGQAMRRCPVTGCAASTCHAETGEPPPSRW